MLMKMKYKEPYDTKESKEIMVSLSRKICKGNVR
jgi:hypothetical protein